jgi:hypothetical protein
VEVTDIIHHQRYPILDLDHPACLDLIATCQAELQKTGACNLSEFVHPQALRVLVEEAQALAPKAFHNSLTGNAYLTPADPRLPEDHPINMTETTALAALAYDQFPLSSPLRRVYESDVLIRFVERVINRGPLYRYADPLGALNLAVMKENDYLRWHFDQSDFVVSILLQDAETGGEFEYAPMIRTPTQENYDRVKAVLKGDRNDVITLNARPGTLAFFEGRYSLHRVTPIQGKRLRLIGLLGYGTSPEVNSTDYLKRIRYGRTQ